MKIEELYENISKLEIPTAYRMFNDEKMPALPFVCYYDVNTNNLYADGIVYFSVKHIYIELYSKDKDFELEHRLESILSDAGMTWESSSDWMEEEKCFITTYEMEIQNGE